MADHGQPSARNRLGCSKSLYLQQHANNPVHWQPWDDEAFERAATKEQPILLSIGYAACHWCHVMARESFADQATATLMNSLFVCIKVDREERPDLDRFYLAAMAAMGKAAGWPLTAFLTPDATPFGGGGYFPPTARFGLPAFHDVLRDAETSYRSTRFAITRTTPRAETPLPTRPQADTAMPQALLDRIARDLAGGIDSLYGGFGTNGPKFLHAAGHEFLLRAWDRTGHAGYLTTVAASVAQMNNGAVFDQVGGGYHRYAVDDRWRVPHFEKMLNDNAMMVRLGTQLWQATKGTLFAARVRATIDWLLQDMRLPGGTLGSSLAADSGGGEDTEGAFYLWTEAELREALGEQSVAFLAAFEAATDEQWPGRHALVRSSEDLDWTDDGDFDSELAVLRAVRQRRATPLRDDKCLADWNGLAITALAEAGMVFRRADWITAAQAIFAAVLDSAAAGSRLAHCTAQGVQTAAGLLDDYAAMSQAALALYEATAEMAYLDQASTWEQVLEAQFWDPAACGYFLTAADAEQRIPRQKLIDETASPAGNGIMLGVLARLHALTGNDRLRLRFEGILGCFAGRMSRAHLQAATALCNSEAAERLAQIVIVGDGDDAQSLRDAAAGHYLADRLLLCLPAGATVPSEHPAHGKTTLLDRPAAYVCFGSRCLPPATTPEQLADRLSNKNLADVARIRAANAGGADLAIPAVIDTCFSHGGSVAVGGN